MKRENGQGQYGPQKLGFPGLTVTTIKGSRRTAGQTEEPGPTTSTATGRSPSLSLIPVKPSYFLRTPPKQAAGPDLPHPPTQQWPPPSRWTPGKRRSGTRRWRRGRRCRLRRRWVPCGSSGNPRRITHPIAG